MNLAQKIANARKLFKDIKKDKKGHDANYADLDSIMSAIKEGLISEGLNIHHTFTPVDIFGAHFFEITCHVSDGENTLMSTVHMPWKEPPSVDKWGKPKTPNLLHEMGKVITYGRRYSLNAALCLSADEDSDAQEVKEPKEPKEPEEPKAKAVMPIKPKEAANAAVNRVHEIRRVQAEQQKSGIFTATEQAIEWLDGVMLKHNLSLDNRAQLISLVSGKTAKEIEEIIEAMAAGQV